MDRPGVGQVPEGSEKQKKKEEKTGSRVICGAPRTVAVKEWVKVKVVHNVAVYASPLPEINYVFLMSALSINSVSFFASLPPPPKVKETCQVIFYL